MSLCAKHVTSSHETPPNDPGKQKAEWGNKNNNNHRKKTHTQSVGRPTGKQTLKASWGEETGGVADGKVIQ